MSLSRALLLSPVEHDPRPDTDLTSVVADLEGAARTHPSCEVVHEPVAALGDVERAVRAHRPDVVFNACETIGGRSEDEPLVPALLERLGVPFTGSTASCLRRCLRKAEASETLRAAGVPVPRVYDPSDVPCSAYPVIVKPEREDGSVGIGEESVARDDRDLRRALAALSEQGRPAIVQQYIEGREISCAILGWPSPATLPPGEILYDELAFEGRARILTYASKWDESSIEYRATRSVGAVLTPALLARLSSRTLRAASALGMRDYGRIDYRVDAAGRCYVIDANPNCDLSRDGGFMRAVSRAGLTHEGAVHAILGGALARAVVGPSRRKAG